MTHLQTASSFLRYWTYWKASATIQAYTCSVWSIAYLIVLFWGPGLTNEDVQHLQIKCGSGSIAKRFCSQGTWTGVQRFSYVPKSKILSRKSWLYFVLRTYVWGACLLSTSVSLQNSVFQDYSTAISQALESSQVQNFLWHAGPAILFVESIPKLSRSPHANFMFNPGAGCKVEWTGSQNSLRTVPCPQDKKKRCIRCSSTVRLAIDGLQLFYCYSTTLLYSPAKRQEYGLSSVHCYRPGYHLHWAHSVTFVLFTKTSLFQSTFLELTYLFWVHVCENRKLISGLSSLQGSQIDKCSWDGSFCSISSLELSLLYSTSNVTNSLATAQVDELVRAFFWKWFILTV